MNSLEFNEQIDIDNGKYLLSLNNDQLKEVIGKPEWKGENLFTNLDVYIKQLKKWLKRAIKQNELNGTSKAKYKFSKNLVDCGRIYVVDFGIQRLTKTLRGFLVKQKTIDIDISNCHPSLLYNIIKKYYSNYESEFLLIKDYYINRNKWLDEYKCTKKQILITMNTNQKIKSNNQRLIKLDIEFKKIQKLIWDTFENKLDLPTTILQKKNNLVKNKEGKYLNVILTFFENNLLQKVMNHNQLNPLIQTPMFDGFTVSKNIISEQEILNICNETTKEDGIKWTIKEHDETIKKDEGIDVNFKSSLTYDEQKIEFEKEHFIIKNPLLFGIIYELDGEEKYQFYGKEKFRDLVKPIKYFDVEKGDLEFFPQWLEDENRRSYKEIKFIPKFEENFDIFNSFKGFNYKHTIFKHEEDDQDLNNVVTKFKNHISLLCNHDIKSTNYLFKYICHLIQKPHQKSSTAIILKSKQGFGKDTLIDMIEKMLGSSYILRTAEMDDIFGSYNIGLRDKLLLQLNEVEGRDGFSNKEKIKNIITEDKTIIREKYISAYDQKNYLRLFILSNNLNPIEITHDDRRFAVFKSHHKKPNQKYFNELHSMIRNDEEMNLLFNYCMNYDISNFDARNDRPQTDAYNNMKEHNENPLYRYMYNMFIKDEPEYKEEFDSDECKKKKNSNTIYIKSNSLFSNYRSFLTADDRAFIKPTFKIIKTILSDIGISKKQVKINEINSDYYIIEVDELKEQLESFNLNVDIPELNDNDFE